MLPLIKTKIRQKIAEMIHAEICVYGHIYHATIKAFLKAIELAATDNNLYSLA